MPSTPHLSSRALVGVLSLAVTLLATWWAMRTRGYPGRPHRWPTAFLQRVSVGFRRGDRETLYWTALGLYSAAVAGLHFGGIRWDVYTAIHWWDLLTHALSGAGVAALLYMTFHAPVDHERSPRWLVPAVLAFGAGFEIYEFVFKDFWYAWTLRFYLVDTVVDLVAGVAGAVLVVGILAFRSLAGRE
ncbi:MAG: hypothetical protein ACOCSF_00925 [Halanaeroarchaeum sp.]